jgi:hypothetical protein
VRLWKVGTTRRPLESALRVIPSGTRTGGYRVPAPTTLATSPARGTCAIVRSLPGWTGTPRSRRPTGPRLPVEQPWRETPPAARRCRVRLRCAPRRAQHPSIRQNPGPERRPITASSSSVSRTTAPTRICADARPSLMPPPLPRTVSMYIRQRPALAYRSMRGSYSHDYDIRSR